MTVAKAFWRLLRSARRGPLVALLVLMVACGLTEGVGIITLVPLLESMSGGVASGWARRLFSLFDPGAAMPGTAMMLAAFLVLVALRSAAQYGRGQLSTRLQHELVDELRHRSFAALLATEWRWLASRRSADQAELLLSASGRVGIGLQFGLSLMAGVATLMAYLLTAFALSWSLTALALLSGLLAFALLSGQRSHALKLGKALTLANRSVHRNIQQTLAGIKVAKILGTEDRHLRQFDRTTQELRAQQIHFSAVSGRSQALFQSGGALLLASYLYIGLQVWHTPIPVLLTLVLIFSRVLSLFMATHQQLHSLLHSLPALQQIDELLADCAREAEPPGQAQPSRLSVAQSIRLHEVTLRYAERQRPALDRLSLEFPARTTTAIMGPSGAGKSTLADVVMGLLEPDDGALIVDGVTIAGPLRRAWRRQVAYVPQEVFLFHDSVRNNLLPGKPTATDDELRHALQRAAAEFVFKLPQGLETVVGDGGILLSGGERQRLALARALLGQPALLILDEATSALDTGNEARIHAAIEQLHGDLTVIVIGHRLPVQDLCDQLVVLDEGRVRSIRSSDRSVPALLQAGS